MSGAHSIPVSTLWVRHCESCSNVADPVEDRRRKFLVPPLCTPLGLQQSLALSFSIDAERRRLNVDPDGVRFFCSFLPRAMLTAGLAANAYYALGAEREARELQRVRVLCSTSELLNVVERAEMAQSERSDCIGKSSESRITARDSNNFRHLINSQFEKVGWPVRIGEVPRCSQSESRCPEGLERAMQSQPEDFKRFLDRDLPDMAEQQRKAGKRLLFVIVSHGAYISSQLFPHAPPFHLENTALVAETFYGGAQEFSLAHFTTDGQEARVVSREPANALALAAALARTEPDAFAVPATGLPAAFASQWKDSQSQPEKLGQSIVMPWYDKILRAWDSAPCDMKWVQFPSGRELLRAHASSL